MSLSKSLLLCSALIACAASVANAGCDGFVKAGATNTFNDIGDSFCFNTSSIPESKNSFQVSVTSNSTSIDDLCVFTSTDCSGRTPSVVLQCNFHVGDKFVVASTCNKPTMHGCSDAWYIGFGPESFISGDNDDDTNHHTKYSFDWQVSYTKTNIC